MGAASKLAQLLAHPSEILPVAEMALAARRAKALPALKADPSLAFCYDMLNKVSRSFAVVIQQLPECLRDPVCVFYLVLRALDTVEDDMAIPVTTKVPLLRTFYERTGDEAFSMDDCGGPGNYGRLMRGYPAVARTFNGLEKGYRTVIADITRRMGCGMADFIERQDVRTVEDYDLYCHYVAGLVGVGLTDLFVSSGLQAPALAKNPSLSNDMGLFLQKTNIIRDYLEDITEEPAPRMFWPSEIWGRYAASLDEFKEPQAAPAALACLNHMVVDAMRHALPALTYMSQVTDPRVFRFCAIPQLMAAATLSLCYDNHGVFEGVVKMRRGETAVVLLRTRSMEDVYLGFAKFARSIAERAKWMSSSGGASSSSSSTATAASRKNHHHQRDPTASLALDRASEIEAACARGLGLKPGQPIPGIDGRILGATDAGCYYGGVLTPVHAAVLIAVAALAVRAAASHPGGISAFLQESSSVKFKDLFFTRGLSETPSVAGAWLAGMVVVATVAAAVAPRLLSLGR